MAFPVRADPDVVSTSFNLYMTISDRELWIYFRFQSPAKKFIERGASVMLHTMYMSLV